MPDFNYTPLDTQGPPTTQRGWGPETWTYDGGTYTPHSSFTYTTPTPGSVSIGQANALGGQEAALLNRQAPTLSAPDMAAMQQARGNQLAALAAQHRQLQGPSLAGLQANQAMGQARQQMGGAAMSNPLAMRQAMLAGNQNLGALAGQGGGAVGQEYAGRLGAIGQGVGALGQGDVNSQNAMQQLAAAQQKLYLTQRGQNLGAAQGYEQNYWDVMSAQQQKALADYKTNSQLQQAQNIQNQQIAGSSAAAAAAIAAAAIGAAAA